MRNLLTAGLTVVVLSGCWAGPPWIEPWGPTGQPMPVVYDNPVLVPIADHQYVWETVVDVVDDYFKIQHEEPLRLIGDTLTEGRLDTFPQVGATVFEPWLDDSAGRYARWESTLQSIRRRAMVRVIPAQGGYWVDVAVFKQLEDVLQPENATAGAATFRYDDSLTRVVNPVGGQEINEGWIPQGRDVALQQRIIGHLMARFGRPGGGVYTPMPSFGAGSAQ